MVSVQSRIEREVERDLDFFAEEFNVPLPRYPEVLLVHRRAPQFEHTFLPFDARAEYDRVRSGAWKGSCLSRHNILLVHEYNRPLLAEEAMHFVHKDCSFKRFRTSPLWGREHKLMLRVLSEMLGFFGSKLICPERKNPFAHTKDYLSLSSHERHLLSVTGFGNPSFDISDYFVYQQGYGLGDALYKGYCKGSFSPQRVYYLLHCCFEKPGSAAVTFFSLKRELQGIHLPETKR